MRTAAAGGSCPHPNVALPARLLPSLRSRSGTKPTSSVRPCGHSASTAGTKERSYTLESADNLAIDLRALGEHEQARTLDADTLIRRRRVLGNDHPDTLRTAAAMAENPPAFGETL